MDNFEYLTILIGNSGERIEADINFYSTNLTKLPEPRVRQSNHGEEFIVVDSTITIFKGPFEVFDATRNSKGYFEQLSNNRLRLCGSNMKGIWTIPFETPSCGNDEQVDFFTNGKQQMMFFFGNNLYILVMLACFVWGYVVAIAKNETLG